MKLIYKSCISYIVIVFGSTILLSGCGEDKGPAQFYTTQKCDDSYRETVTQCMSEKWKVANYRGESQAGKCKQLARELSCKSIKHPNPAYTVWLKQQPEKSNEET